MKTDLLVGLVATVILAVLFVLGFNYYATAQRNKWKAEVREQAIEVTRDALKAAKPVDVQRAVIDAAPQVPRVVFLETMTEAKKNDPQVADRADSAVPASVRAAYRERRIARERYLGGEANNDPRARAETAGER